MSSAAFGNDGRIEPFIKSLFQIVSEESSNIIKWSSDGQSFHILSPALFATTILPKYFRHQNMSSFQRQLNYYGFKKMNKGVINQCTYNHRNFSMHKSIDLHSIKRRRATGENTRKRKTMGERIQHNKRYKVADNNVEPLQIKCDDLSGDLVYHDNLILSDLSKTDISCSDCDFWELYQVLYSPNRIE